MWRQETDATLFIKRYYSIAPVEASILQYGF